MIRLLEAEAMAEAQRTGEVGHYSVTRHVAIMTALMAEGQIVAARSPRLVGSAAAKR